MMNLDDLGRAVTKALHEHASKIAAEEAEEACKRVRARVAAAAGDIAAQLVKSVSLTNPLDGTLDIVVRLKAR